MEHSAIATGRIGSGIVHGIGAASGGTLADVAVVAQGEQHEVLAEIVLPEEDLCFLGISGETNIARQAVAVNFDISAVDTLQRHFPFSSVHDSELCEPALVFSACVIEQAVRVADGRTAIRQIDDAEGLAVRDVAAAVGMRLFYGEVVELGISSLFSLMVEGEECMA